MSAVRKKRLEWSRLGLRELWESFEYIAADNLPAALAIRERIENAAGLLAEQPLIGKPGQKPGTREYPIRGVPYTLVYRVIGSVIKIGRVLHQRRKYP